MSRQGAGGGDDNPGRPTEEATMKGASLTDRLQAVAEGLLLGAVAKAKRGERWDWNSGLSDLGLVPTSAATGRAYQGRWNTLFLRAASAGHQRRETRPAKTQRKEKAAAHLITTSNHPFTKETTL